MTSRERVLIALRHEKPDRTPRLLYGEVIGYVPAIRALLTERCAPRSPREYFDMDITAAAPNPTRLPPSRFEAWHPAVAGSESAPGTAGFNWASASAEGSPVDEWGVWWRAGGTHHFVRIESPLASLQDAAALDDYPWPDLEEPYRWEGFAERVRALQDQGLAVAAYAGAIYEQAWYLRGMENLLEDLLLHPALAHALLERTAHYQRMCAAEMAKAGVDIVMLGDDVAHQRGLVMGRETWREFLKPRLKASIDAVRDVRPDVAVFYHSDGDIRALIPELIEAGVTILNPVQPECMDPAAIKAQYGRQLSFWGTVSVQRTMPFGTPDDVRREVRTRIETVGCDGGLILAPAHVLEPEVPWENIVAFFEAADA